MLIINKKITNLGYYFFIPLLYLSAGIFFIYFKLIYFNYPELLLIFNLFLLLLFVEVCIKFGACPKNYSGLPEEWNRLVAFNVMFLFVICGAFILNDYLSLLTEIRAGKINGLAVGYLSVSPFENLVRLFIVFLFLINL